MCPTAAALSYYSLILKRVPGIPPPARVHDAPQTSFYVALALRAHLWQECRSNLLKQSNTCALAPATKEWQGLIHGWQVLESQ
jgi:hypothetical protein